MQIKAIMTPEVHLIDPETSIRAVAQKMRDDVGAVPVAEHDRLVGMVTDRDIVLRAVAEGGDMGSYTARQVMSPNVLYCFDDQSRRCEMKENQVRRLPVLNRDKRLVGMVSLGDLAQHSTAEQAGEALKGISRTGHRRAIGPVTPPGAPGAPNGEHELQRPLLSQQPRLFQAEQAFS
jgi:CBS domain-containing protein